MCRIDQILVTRWSIGTDTMREAIPTDWVLAPLDSVDVVVVGFHAPRRPGACETRPVAQSGQVRGGVSAGVLDTGGGAVCASLGVLLMCVGYDAR